MYRADETHQRDIPAGERAAPRTTCATRGNGVGAPAPVQTHVTRADGCLCFELDPAVESMSPVDIVLVVNRISPAMNTKLSRLVRRTVNVQQACRTVGDNPMLNPTYCQLRAELNAEVVRIRTLQGRRLPE
jgi:hypothetical protein